MNRLQHGQVTRENKFIVMKLYWMQPGEIDSISGGYIYNKNIIESIRAQSIEVELLNPGTDFPFPSKKSIENCRELFQNIESSSIVIIDSLILGIIPDLIEEFASKFTIAGMIHLPLSLSPDFTNDEKKHIKQNEIESFKHSKILFVTSEYSKSETVRMGIDEAKIHVVTPGINSTIKQKNYPDNPEKILCVSHISSSKGQLDLIKALENLQQFEWKLTFCGGFDEKDEYYKEIRKRISVSGMKERIVFTGEIQGLKLEDYYNQADLLILTSYFETFSMVLQEAMAFKLPIISTNSGATSQTADSLIAKFYEPGNIVQLKTHLFSVLNNGDEYKKLANGYSKLDLKFITWGEKAKQFLRIFNK